MRAEQTLGLIKPSYLPNKSVTTGLFGIHKKYKSIAERYFYTSYSALRLIRTQRNF